MGYLGRTAETRWESRAEASRPALYIMSGSPDFGPFVTVRIQHGLPNQGRSIPLKSNGDSAHVRTGTSYAKIRLPHAARRTPHAARRTPAAARRTPPASVSCTRSAGQPGRGDFVACAAKNELGDT